MRTGDLLRTAVGSLLVHGFRSTLACLGVVLGVSSVLAMLAISDGARRQALERISVLGVDNMTLRTVDPSAPTAATAGGAPGVLAFGLRRIDLEHVRQTLPGVRYLAAFRNMRMRLYSPHGERLEALNVIATEPDYLKVIRGGVARGRFLSSFDEQALSQVAVLGEGAARLFFPFRDPLHEWIRIGSDWYLVIGILESHAKLRDAGGDDVDRSVFVPLGLAQSRYGDVVQQLDAGVSRVSRVELDGIAIQFRDSSLVVPSANRLRAYLEKTHASRDYALQVPLELIEQATQTQRIFAIVMGSIGAISLVVGGIGIMNMMLANVSDRRREIGTRRALGATRRGILLQFLLESAALATVGGLLGVACGAAIAHAVAVYANWPITLTGWAALLSLSVALGTGITFGIWPAYQAASVRPIEALRSA